MYEIQGWYSRQYGWEMVTTEDAMPEALACLREYQENEPSIQFRMRKVADDGICPECGGLGFIQGRITREGDGPHDVEERCPLCGIVPLGETASVETEDEICF